MSRYIDADAAKKDIARLHVLNDEAEIRRAYEYNPHVTSTDFEETLVSVFDAIDDAPSIDIEPKRGEWILCSERLPNKDGRYLITFPSLINEPWVDILWYGRPLFPETDHPCFYASDDEYGDVEYDDVVAWMPLPEPYFKESE